MLIQENDSKFKDCVEAKATGAKCSGSNCMAWEYCDPKVTDKTELTTNNKGDFWGFCAKTYGPPKCKVRMSGKI
jgi:hypothetical protein